MTTAQPLALALAKKISRTDASEWDLLAAAAALRRQHAEIEALRAAITKLHKAKGRYHTQLAVCDLFELCGLTAVRPARAGEKT
jgi:hypothetical protein